MFCDNVFRVVSFEKSLRWEQLDVQGTVGRPFLLNVLNGRISASVEYILDNIMKLFHAGTSSRSRKS